MSAPLKSAAEAQAALHRGAFEEALAFARTHLEHNPRDVTALLLRGQAANETSRFLEAKEAFAAALALAPDHAPALCGLATACVGLRDPRAGLDAAQRALALSPGAADAYFPMGPAAICAGDEAAISACLAFADAAPEPLAMQLVEYWAACLAYLSKYEDAARIFAVLIARAPPTARRFVTFANYLLQARQSAHALEVIERAIALDPNDASARVMHARWAVLNGERDVALSASREALRCDPNLASPLSTIAELAPGTITDDEVERLKSWLAGATGPTLKSVIAARALAMALEARGAYDSAFDAYAHAAAMDAETAERTGCAYSAKDTEQKVRDLIAQFPPAVLTRPSLAPDRGRQFIFVLGMPRSGTTLIEQILAAHSDVQGVGESHGMGRVVERFNAATEQTGRPADQIVEDNAEAWEHIYKAALAGADKQAARVVDKMPANFWRIGVIARLFPAAKILLLQRDPMDVCLSIFRHHFKLASSYPVRLEDIVHYHRCFAAICAHWRAAAPGLVRTVVYENLVENFEAEVRAILADCGLTFEEQCLRFHESRSTVYTHSASQVRTGINKSSLGKWRRYETHLTPFREVLATPLM